MSGNAGSESLFRSATMSLIQLFIPSEVAHATVSELGELGNVQFKDVSGAERCRHGAAHDDGC